MNKNSDLRAENEALRQKIAALENQLAWNVSARKMSTDILTESSGRFHALFETMAQGVVYQDADGHIFLANPAAERILGLSLDEMQGRSSIDPRWHAIREDGSAFPGEQHPAMLALKTGKPIQDIVMGVFHPRESAYRWILVNAMPEFRNDEPTPYRVYATFTDITENKQAEEKLRDSEEFLRLAYEAADLGIWKNDLASGVVYFDERARAHYGFDRLETTLSEVMSRIHPDDAARLGSEIAAATAPTGSGKFATEYRVIHPDGSVRWLAIGIRVTFEGAGQQRRALVGYGTSRDITERKRAELALRRSEHVLRLFVEHAPAAIAMLDTQMRYIAASHRYLRDYGLGEQDVTGHSHYEIFPEIPERWKEIHQRCLGGEIEHAEADPFPRADGSLDWVRWEIRPWYESEGRVGGLLLFSEVITERKQVENALRESEEKYRALINGMNDTVWVIDKNARILDANDTAIKMLGYSREELLTMQIPDIDASLAPEQIQQMLDKMTADQQQRFETCHKAKDGREIPVEISSSLVSYMGKMVVMSIARDITERKQAEEKLQKSEKRLRSMLEISLTMSGMLDLKAILQKIVDNAAGLLGLASGVIYTLEGDELFLEATTPPLPPDFPDALRRADITKHARIQAAISSGSTVILPDARAEELTDDEKMAVEARGLRSIVYIPLLISEKAIGVLIVASVDELRVFTDDEIDLYMGFAGQAAQTIANIRLYQAEQEYAARLETQIAEREQAEAALRESEQRFAALFRSNPVPLGITRASDYRIVEVNDAWIKLTGYARDEAIGHNTVELGLARPETLQQIRALLKTQGNIHQYEIPLYTRSGQERQVLITSEPLELGGETYRLNNLLDITERKQFEDALRESEASLKQSQAVAHVGHWSWDTRTNKVAWSEEMKRIFGLDPQTFDGDLNAVIDQAIHPDDQVLLRQANEAVLNEQATTPLEYRVIWPCGSIRYIWAQPGEKVTDEDGKILRLTGIVQDITERNQAETALRESEEKYRTLITATTDGVYIAQDEKFIFANPALPANLGYTPEEFENMPFAQVLAPEYLELWTNRYRLRLAGKNPPPNYQVQFLHKSGEKVWFDIRATVITYHERPAVFGIARDITEYKQAQAALAESERLLRLALETTSDGFWIVDANRRFRDVNPAYCAMTGYTREEILGLSIQDIEVLESVVETEARVQKILGQGWDRFETRHRRKDGSIFDAEISVNLLDKENGLMICFLRDITERKQAEYTLRQSNERFTQLAENIDDIFWMVDPLTYRDIYVSPAFEKIIGRSPENIAQLPGKFLDVLLPEDRSILARAREEEKNGLSTDIQYRIQRPDGAVRWLRDKGSPVFDDDGRVVRVVGIAHDMTDEVETNARLRESEERFRRIAETIDELFWMADLDFDNILYASQSYERIWGRTLQSLYENPASFTDAIHPNDRERILADFRNQSHKKPFSREFRIIQPDGSERWVWSRVYTVQRESGQPRYFVGVLQDITERKQAEAESLYRQARLELVVQLGKNITAITDLDKCLRAIHHSVSRGLQFDRVGVFLYDASRQVISGVYGTSRSGKMESNDWFDESIRDHSDWQVALQSPAGIAFTENYQALHNPSPESEMYGVKEHVTLAAWAGDNPVALLTVDNLVSGRPIPPADLEALQLFAGYAGLAIENARMNTLLEQRVRERTAEVQDLYDNAPTGYHSLDAEGRFVRINKTELGWLGYTREEMVGRRFSDILTPESLETFKASFPLFKQRGWVRDLEFELVRKDGSSLPVLLNATAVYDEAGKFLNSRSTIFDNTERKQAEAALRESEETYRALFENATDAIFLLDVPTGTYARLNPRCAALLGVPTAEELLGRHAHEFIRPSDMADANEHMQALLSGRPQPTYERTFVRVDGSFVETEINLSLIHDGQGNPRYVQSVVRDISERKKVEQVLRRANLELERAMRMKDEFLASMSHELRTPLTGILGLSEALQMKTYGDLNERQLRSLKNIETSGRHLLELINDILDLSKIEAGKFDMQFEPCSLGDICQASLQLTRGMAHKKQQRVSFAIEPASLVVRADPRRLKQMLVNLLSNAIKFTPEGGSLGLEVRADGKAGVVAITVWDKGMGIAEENLKRLFKPFVQLDSSLARQHSGTGLGLSLVQRMAELHGGSVRVESAPGEGSRFTILLPWSPQATQPVRRANVGAGSLHPSLTVEDSEIDAEHITRYLRHLGIENTVHPLGRESVEVAVRIKPGVILLDLHLPDMSGFDVLAALKADPRTRGIPVVICSVEESRQKALAQGAAGYLIKPFTLNDVRIELARVASEQEFHESVLTIAPRHAIPRILVVDDNEVTLETISDFLAVQKFQVWSARSGMEALDQASQTHPDLILMDIQMPGMDGLETIRRIRAHADSQVARTPIIALTALAMPGDREMCMEAGANEYLTKPVQLKQLAETIRAMLSLP